MTDTPIEILNIQREIFSKKTMKERFEIGAETIDFGRFVVESSIKKTNPDISEIDMKIELLKRYYKNIFRKEDFELIVQSMITYHTKNQIIKI